MLLIHQTAAAKQYIFLEALAASPTDFCPFSWHASSSLTHHAYRSGRISSLKWSLKSETMNLTSMELLTMQSTLAIVSMVRLLFNNLSLECPNFKGYTSTQCILLQMYEDSIYLNFDLFQSIELVGSLN